MRDDMRSKSELAQPPTPKAIDTGISSRNRTIGHDSIPNPEDLGLFYLLGYMDVLVRAVVVLRGGGLWRRSGIVMNSISI